RRCRVSANVANAAREVIGQRQALASRVEAEDFRGGRRSGEKESDWPGIDAKVRSGGGGCACARAAVCNRNVSPAGTINGIALNRDVPGTRPSYRGVRSVAEVDCGKLRTVAGSDAQRCPNVRSGCIIEDGFDEG